MHTQLADYFMRESMCSSNTCKADGGLDFYHILEWHLVAVSLITPQPLIAHYSSVQGVFLLTYLKQDLVFCLFFCLIICVSLGQYRKWFVLREILPSVGSKTVQEHENADRQGNHFLLSLYALKQTLGNIFVLFTPFLLLFTWGTSQAHLLLQTAAEFPRGTALFTISNLTHLPPICFLPLVPASPEYYLI